MADDALWREKGMNGKDLKPNKKVTVSIFDNGGDPDSGSNLKGGSKEASGSKLPALKQNKNAKQYDHPIFSCISRENGLINRMGIEDVCNKLSMLGLNKEGKLEILQKRLKNHIREEKLREAEVDLNEEYKIDYFVVIDFEATCEDGNPAGFIQEIIEFPAVLIDVRKQEIVSEFHYYCKPVRNTQLTEFCIQLTGIKQDIVACAPTFPTVLRRFDEWLKRELKPTDLFAVLTDGPWDVSRFLVGQCKQCDLELPHYYKTWVNIRKHFGNYYKVQRANLDEMLTNLGMTFAGRPHSGIDDARNIARIAIQMLKDGCKLKINDTL